MSARRALLASLVLIGCRAAPAPSEPPPELPHTAQPVASTSASAPPAPAASASAPRRVDDGCWGTALAASPVERVAQLEKRCAQGLKPALPEPRRVSASEAVELPPLPPFACLRLAVVAPGEVAAELRDSQGDLLASDRGQGLALLDPQGPLCLGKGKTPRLSFKAEGEALLQVWVSKTP